MTRKLSITLPDDVAEHLDGVENASAYIAEAIRIRRSRDRRREMFAKHGYRVTDEGSKRAGEILRAAEARRGQAE